MSEIQSFLFDFKKVSDFWDNWNIKFKIADMGVADKFQLVFCTYAPNSIEDCLNNGQINTTNVTVSDVIDCTLDWEDNTISFGEDATLTIGDDELMLKAIFLRDKTTEYVMAYSINLTEFDVTNTLTFDEGTILWSIKDE